MVVGMAPIIYFLTQTRPALDHSWSAPEISVEARINSLEKMISRGHVPRYLVRTWEPLRSELSSENVKLTQPLHAFAGEHYSFEIKFRWLEIWRLRD